MSVESKIERLSLDLRNVGLVSNKSSKSTRSKKPDPVAESWEDDTSDTDDATRSPSSIHSVPLEAPGPTHLKSPTTRAQDAERELDNPLNLNATDVPPPTPISPDLGGVRSSWLPARNVNMGRLVPTSQATSISSSGSSPRSNPPLASSPSTRKTTLDEERKRPEKTTATANRLIAGALGIRAPPKTEEQKKYDRAVKEAEIKRRNKEREEKERAREENEKAKNAVWES